MNLFFLMGLASLFVFIPATRIGDDLVQPVTSAAQSKAAAPVIAGEESRRNLDPGGVIAKKVHVPQRVIPIDKRAFLASFRRQAQERLLPCLGSWREGRNSLLLVGRLYSDGQLSNLLVLDEQVELPDCVGQAIAQMNFSAVTSALGKGNSQAIQWQIDW